MRPSLSLAMERAVLMCWWSPLALFGLKNTAFVQLLGVSSGLPSALVVFILKTRPSSQAPQPSEAI
jgi:hypothetical protein